MKRTHVPAAMLGVVALAALSGCIGGGTAPATPVSEAPEAVTLTLTTFGTVDFSAQIAAYSAAHPEVTVVQDAKETGADAYAALAESLAGGTLPGDLVLVDDAWLGELLAHPEATADLAAGANAASANWYPWQVEQGTDQSGRIVALPLTTRPLALCYNGAKLAAAGFPDEPEKVAAVLQGDWAHAFEIATMYKEATGLAFFDTATTLWPAMVRQLPDGLGASADEVNLAANEGLTGRWSLLTSAVGGGLTAKQTPGDWAGGKAMIDGTFAAFLCEPGDLASATDAILAGGGDASTGWAVADVMPGGAASAGGSYLAVGRSADHDEQAAALALWLTAPEQQASIAGAAGLVPAGPGAQQRWAETAGEAEVFGGANIGSLVASRSADVPTRAVGEVDAFLLDQAFAPAVQGLEQGTLTAEQAWQQVLTAAATVVPPPPSPES